MKIKDITRALRFDIMRALLLASLLLAMPAIAGAAGHIAPVGVTIEKASQLVVWYDQSILNVNDDDLIGNTVVQVTNASLDTAVNIHVQIFADDVEDSTNRCREHDFNDTLTPLDTVVYMIGNLNLADVDDSDAPPFPVDPGGDNLGNPIPIDLDLTRGFIVITPVDTVTLPRQAIAFNQLFASVYIFSIDSDPDVLGALAFNAMGREAVDFATGALAANGVLLDGINAGYRVIQPSFLSFSWDDIEISTDFTHVVSIAFSDNYSDPSGEYRAEPATAVWDPLMFNQFEQGTSCQQHTQTCFVTTGLNDEWETEIREIDATSESNPDLRYPDLELCPAVDTDPGGSFNNDIGWVSIAVSALSGLDNNVGLFAYHEDSSSNYAKWMFAE